MPKQLLVRKLIKFSKKIPKFSINFFTNSNVSLELKQKEKLVLKNGGESSQRKNKLVHT
jgi:hypothetical protein